MIKLKFKILGALALISAIVIDCTSLVKPATAQTAASLAYNLKQAGAKMYGASKIDK